MDDKGEAVSARQMKAVLELGPGLFDLGRCVATPGALALLDRVNVYPATLLAWHSHGEYGVVSDEDRAANIAALKSGARIWSVYQYSGEKVWVITEARGDDGRRASTCILLPSDH